MRTAADNTDLTFKSEEEGLIYARNAGFETYKVPSLEFPYFATRPDMPERTFSLATVTENRFVWVED